MLGFGATGQFAIGEVGAATAETITIDKWFIALSEPVRTKPGLSSQVQPFFSFAPNPLVSFGWFGALSDPVRIPPINPAALRQDFFMQMAPSPFVATGWFNWLSEPVRLKPGLRPELQPFISYQADPTTVTPFAWFAALSEPVRLPNGIKSYLQQVTVQDTNFIPSVSTLVKFWFSPLSEPRRFPKGLGVQFQPDYTAHPRILPKPNVTVNINTIEINSDTATIAVNVVKSNPPATAKVSIIEIGSGLSATSVIEH
jgi:hypothetical protein